ncbi:uncharacterized protein LOC111338606 [Stylophora pistillata]|uniref:THAP domain-containing protein 2 n=1 Tax=Stylophora pistillata TaxID=50429 RepID=A0A2B4RNE1_STYPI|nr:uncharacterized protein LOC111338606 [Stylophora pistillata]PFX19131.1 THAP domain-containing protein 2 [Stylophora pistillata]
MVYCTAYNCNNDGKKMKSLSFFQFPSDEKYRQIWIEKVRRVNWEPNKYSRLCSAHFEPHCFVHNFKLFESLGLPKPKKATLKHDAIPTIFDYEERTTKPSNELTLSRKRKHENSTSNTPWKGRKVLEVIDFNSLLDDYLKGLQSEEDFSSANEAGNKTGSDELVKEIIPGSSPCKGGDRFVLLLSKPLSPDICDTSSSLLCVRFGSEYVVPVTLWKEQVIRGDSVPKSDKPGVVVAQLETTDGKVLGSTKFLYKEEISTGFQKIVCSKNYGGKLIKGLSDFGAKEDPVTVNESEANQDVTSLHTSESSLALAGILKMMLYIAAKHDAISFVEDLFRTKAGKAVMNSFSKKDQQEETANQSNLEQQLFSYLENVSGRITEEEEKRNAKVAPKVSQVVEKKHPKPVVKPELKKKKNQKVLKTVPKNRDKTKLTSKKPINGNGFVTGGTDIASKTNSLLLLSNIALGDLNSESIENGLSSDSSLTSLQDTLLSASSKKKKQLSYQSNNAKKFTRKLVLLPTSSTRLPSQNAAVHRGSIQLENHMPPEEVMKEVRTVLHNLGKKRFRLAAADSSGKLEFFRGTKWTARTLRQRIRFNSVLYVVPSR